MIANKEGSGWVLVGSLEHRENSAAYSAASEQAKTKKPSGYGVVVYAGSKNAKETIIKGSNADYTAILRDVTELPTMRERQMGCVWVGPLSHPAEPGQIGWARRRDINESSESREDATIESIVIEWCTFDGDREQFNLSQSVQENVQ